MPTEDGCGCCGCLLACKILQHFEQMEVVPSGWHGRRSLEPVLHVHLNDENGDFFQMIPGGLTPCLVSRWTRTFIHRILLSKDDHLQGVDGSTHPTCTVDSARVTEANSLWRLSIKKDDGEFQKFLVVISWLMLVKLVSSKHDYFLPLFCDPGSHFLVVHCSMERFWSTRGQYSLKWWKSSMFGDLDDLSWRLKTFSRTISATWCLQARLRWSNSSSRSMWTQTSPFKPVFDAVVSKQSPLIRSFSPHSSCN